jgi:hypothetical protein
MPLVSVGPKTPMQTSILGKMPKMCQFFGGYLAVKLRLAAELPALPILAEQYARAATSGEISKWGPIAGTGDEVRRRDRIGVVELFGMYRVAAPCGRGALNVVGARVFLIGATAYNKL